MQPVGQFAGIQAARGLAAVLVVIHHAAGTLALSKYAGLAIAGGFFVPFGRAGVDFFFVLSGFIIYWVHGADIGHREQLGTYGAKRLARIFPVYWVIFAVLVAVYFAAPGLGLGHERTPQALLSGLVLFPMPQPPIVGVAWTLSHELLFYGLFAVMIASRRIGVALIAGWALCIVVSLSLGEQAYPFSFIFNVKNLEFLLGIGVAMAVRRTALASSWQSAALVIAGAAIFTATAVLELFTSEFRHSPQTLLYGLGAAMMLLGVVQAERAGQIKSVPGWMKLIGDASYSVYLFHFTILVVLIKITKATGLMASVPLPLLLVALVATATAAGVGIYRLIERPLTRSAQRWLLARMAPRPALGTT